MTGATVYPNEPKVHPDDHLIDDDDDHDDEDEEELEENTTSMAGGSSSMADSMASSVSGLNSVESSLFESDSELSDLDDDDDDDDISLDIDDIDEDSEDELEDQEPSPNKKKTLTSKFFAIARASSSDAVFGGRLNSKHHRGGDSSSSSSSKKPTRVVFPAFLRPATAEPQLTMFPKARTRRGGRRNTTTQPPRGGQVPEEEDYSAPPLMRNTTVDSLDQAARPTRGERRGAPSVDNRRRGVVRTSTNDSLPQMAGRRRSSLLGGDKEEEEVKQNKRRGVVRTNTNDSLLGVDTAKMHAHHYALPDGKDAAVLAKPKTRRGGRRTRGAALQQQQQQQSQERPVGPPYEGPVPEVNAEANNTAPQKRGLIRHNTLDGVFENNKKDVSPNSPAREGGRSGGIPRTTTGDSLLRAMRIRSNTNTAPSYQPRRGVARQNTGDSLKRAINILSRKSSRSKSPHRGGGVVRTSTNDSLPKKVVEPKKNCFSSTRHKFMPGPSKTKRGGRRPLRSTRKREALPTILDASSTHLDSGSEHEPQQHHHEHHNFVTAPAVGA